MAGTPRQVSFSERALTGLAGIQRYRHLSVNQFARVAGLKPSFVRELLRDYERRSVLGAIGNVGLPGGAKAPKLYYLTKTGHALMMMAMGSSAAEDDRWRKPHTGTRWSPIMGHRMATVDLLIALEIGLAARAKYRLVGEFIEYRRVARGGRTARPETSDFVADPAIGANRIVPDAAFVLENVGSGNRGLFFLEVDRGTERIEARVHGVYSVVDKFQQYGRYLTGGRFAKTYSAWGTFPFFTMLFVTTTEGRLRNVVESTKKLDQKLHPYFSLAIIDDAKAEFFGAIWTRHDARRGTRTSIVKD